MSIKIKNRIKPYNKAIEVDSDKSLSIRSLGLLWWVQPDFDRGTFGSGGAGEDGAGCDPSEKEAV